MTIVLDDPEAIEEIETLMKRFGLSSKDVVERVIIDAGMWMPMETLGYERPLASKRQQEFVRQLELTESGRTAERDVVEK